MSTSRVRKAASIVWRDLRSAGVLDSWHGRLRLRVLLVANYLLFPVDTRVGVYWPAQEDARDA